MKTQLNMVKFFKERKEKKKCLLTVAKSNRIVVTVKNSAVFYLESMYLGGTRHDGTSYIRNGKTSSRTVERCSPEDGSFFYELRQQIG